MKPVLCVVFTVLAGVAVAVADRLEDTSYVPYEHKAIQYFETPTNEAVKRLDDIEQAINRMKVPLAFADQFYVLRVHVGFVRDHVLQTGQAAAQAPDAAAPTPEAVA